MQQRGDSTPHQEDSPHARRKDILPPFNVELQHKEEAKSLLQNNPQNLVRTPLNERMPQLASVKQPEHKKRAWKAAHLPAISAHQEHQHHHQPSTHSNHPTKTVISSKTPKNTTLVAPQHKVKKRHQPLSTPGTQKAHQSSSATQKRDASTLHTVGQEASWWTRSVHSAKSYVEKAQTLWHALAPWQQNLSLGLASTAILGAGRIFGASSVGTAAPTIHEKNGTPSSTWCPSNASAFFSHSTPFNTAQDICRPHHAQTSLKEWYLTPCPEHNPDTTTSSHPENEGKKQNHGAPAQNLLPMCPLNGAQCLNDAMLFLPYANTSAQNPAGEKPTQNEGDSNTWHHIGHFLQQKIWRAVSTTPSSLWQKVWSSPEQAQAHNAQSQKSGGQDSLLWRSPLWKVLGIAGLGVLYGSKKLLLALHKKISAQRLAKLKQKQEDDERRKSQDQPPALMLGEQSVDVKEGDRQHEPSNVEDEEAAITPPRVAREARNESDEAAEDETSGVFEIRSAKKPSYSGLNTTKNHSHLSPQVHKKQLHFAVCNEQPRPPLHTPKGPCEKCKAKTVNKSTPVKTIAPKTQENSRKKGLEYYNTVIKKI